MKVALLIAIALVAAGALVTALGASRWDAATREWTARLGHPEATTVVTRGGLDTLPPPVARYLRQALREGQPRYRSAELRQEGEFLARAPEGWRPFTATHSLTTDPAGFVWDAAIALAPALRVRVRDRYVGGVGAMHGALLGLITVVRVEGTRDIAEGALHRWLAEGPWCPTVLLPRQGLTWAPVDDTTARATVTDGGTVVSADFIFGPDGMVSRVRVPARMRDVEGIGVPTPWEGRFEDYRDIGGMRIPTRGDVGWILDGRWQPYFGGRIIAANYR